MKFINTALFFLAVILAVLLGDIAIQATQETHIHLMRIATSASQSTGMWFLISIYGFIWDLVLVLLPSGIGLVVLFTAERLILKTRAPKQGFIPVWASIALLIAAIESPVHLLMAFVYGTILLVGIHSLSCAYRSCNDEETANAELTPE